MIFILKWFFLRIKLFYYLILPYFSSSYKGSYYANLGVTYFELQKYNKAISVFKRAEDLNAGQNHNLSKYNAYYLGFSSLNLGNHQQAADNFEQYLKFEPKDREIIELFAWCNLLLRRNEQALENYLELAALAPNDPTYAIESAKIFIELNRKDEAYKQLEFAKGPNRNLALNLLIDSLRHRFNNDLENAISLLEQAIEKITAEKRSQLYSQLGDIYILLSEYKKQNGDLDGAISVLEGLCAVTPNDLWALNCLSFEYAEKGINLEKALSNINLCLKYQPENSFFIDTKAWVQFKMGMTNEAKKLIEKSLELNPHAKETQEHYKELCKALVPSNIDL